MNEEEKKDLLRLEKWIRRMGLLKEANLIDKLQKENQNLKEKINKVVLMIDDNYSSEWYDDYETIAGLRDDIYDLLKNKYKGVKE